jgi:DNA-binding CsgD family transcriptional regulator
MGAASSVHKPAVKDSARPKVAASVTKEAAGSLDVSTARLLAQLVQRARQLNARMDRGSDPALRPPSGREEVLLDIEANGVRCMILGSEPERQPERQPERDPLVLSPREQEIVRMVMKGYPNKTIAAVLEISAWTVGTYLRRIYARLGVGTRAAMVARVLELGPRELL